MAHFLTAIHRRERIDAAVRQVYEASQGVYGSVKIAKKLAGCDELETACRNTVAQAMREMGLKSRVSKAFRPTTCQSARKTSHSSARENQPT
jgi:putative transposase